MFNSGISPNFKVQIVVTGCVLGKNWKLCICIFCCSDIHWTLAALIIQNNADCMRMNSISELYIQTLSSPSEETTMKTLQTMEKLK